MIVALALVSASATPPPPATILRTAAPSTSLASVGYDSASEVMEIEFRSGALCRYFAVPADIYRELMHAESKGRFFSQRIRNHYRFKRIRGERP